MLVLGRVLLVLWSLDESSPDPVPDVTEVGELDEAAVVAVSVSLAGSTLTGGVPATVVRESSLPCVEVGRTAAAR